ncbi:MGMT family protein [Candidatus Amoebophilus asiaticus]|nr:MGMT family protein [Candidatus Amoebophilus asiaticus]
MTKKSDNNSFFLKVYQVVKQIPYGRVSTYGAIASYLGTAGASRMVGWAMNNSHTYDEHVPAHRVVNRNGRLTGKHHFGSPTLMQELLESEGVVVMDDEVKEFEKVFWDPLKELEM